jgi:hypothetical protein
MKFEFMVDDITSTAVVVGNAGMSPIDVHVGRLGLTFMEKLSADDPARRSHSLGGSSSSALRMMAYEDAGEGTHRRRANP